jgi:hypothetical protein
MEVVCEWFVATAEEVRRAFPNWREPLFAPVHRQARNPFTEELMFKGDGAPFMVDSYRPEPSQGLSPECPTLADFWSINFWPLGAFEVTDLAVAVGVAHPIEARDALFAQRSSGWSLHQLPDLVLRALIESREDTQAVAQRWAQACLRRVDSEDAEHDPYHLIGEWQPVVSALNDLCRRARSESKNVYIYQGCCVPTGRAAGARGW